MKLYTSNRLILCRIFLLLLACFGVTSFSSSAVLALAKKKIYQKSLLPLYGNVEAQNDLECVTCQERKCHDGHTFCPICEETCQKCAKECKECKSVCSICLDNHREMKNQKEVVLTCNHTFGEECIKGWENEQKNCPLCRKVIEYSLCALCHDTIREWEAACTYDCQYRCWGWAEEKHRFHRRCIEPYARKAAFVSDQKIGAITKGDVVFFCPVVHKNGSDSSTVDLRVLLSKVVPLKLYRNERFPLELAARDKSLCKICHATITPQQEKCRYVCNYRDYGWREEEHVFHVSCLKPYAERNAFMQKKHGVETGKIVFHCPVLHEREVWYPEKGDLEIELLPGFKPECVLYFCVVCGEDLQTDDPDTIMAEFHGFPSKLLNCDSIHEKQYYHKACFGKHVSCHGRQTVEWGGRVKAVYACPCHKGTRWEHEMELISDAIEFDKGPNA